MNVLFISPGFPAEMPFFTRGLGEVGATVIGIGDQPESMIPDTARPHLAAYFQLERLWDEDAVVAEVRRITKIGRIDRVECLWEPGMILAARLREALDVPGMRVPETVPFRDKESMKQVLDRAGIRTPRHRRAVSDDEIRAAAGAIGYPLVVKPIAGAGSADTHRVDDPAGLEAVLPKIAHVPEVSVEEFIDGEEFTFDTVCANGEILFENMAWYRPRPLIARTLQWVSPQTVTLRNIDRPELEVGRRMGREVLKALGYRTGFTHMEWFLKPDGEAVFGEIAARAPGAKSVDLMNYCCEGDLFTAWAEASCHGRITQDLRRRYNSVVIFKRAQGEGRIQRVDGLDGLLASFGPYIRSVELLPIGAPRRNWKATLLSDGYVFLRHHDLQTALEMADRVGTDLRMVAGR